MVLLYLLDSSVIKHHNTQVIYCKGQLLLLRGETAIKRPLLSVYSCVGIKQTLSQPPLFNLSKPPYRLYGMSNICKKLLC